MELVTDFSLQADKQNINLVLDSEEVMVDSFQLLQRVLLHSAP